MFATSRNGRQSKGGDVSSELRELRNAMTELRTAVGGANKMEQASPGALLNFSILSIFSSRNFSTLLIRKIFDVKNFFGFFKLGF